MQNCPVKAAAKKREREFCYYFTKLEAELKRAHFGSGQANAMTSYVRI
jgi:hypothetical protein